MQALIASTQAAFSQLLVGAFESGLHPLTLIHAGLEKFGSHEGVRDQGASGALILSLVI